MSNTVLTICLLNHRIQCPTVGYLTPGAPNAGRLAPEGCPMTVTIVKLDGSQEHVSDDAVDELRTKLRGQLVLSDDLEARIEPRELWNAMHADRPAITVRCAGTADVMDAVDFARGRGRLVAV